MKEQALIIIVVAVILSGCNTRRSEPFRGPITSADSLVTKGEIAFMQYCHKCHPHGESGLGPALNPIPAPKFYFAFQVRHGVGVMPSFRKDEITEDDLKNILIYLKKLKRNK